MRLRWYNVLLPIALPALLVLASTAASAGKKTSGIEWQSDYRTALHKAQKSHRDLLVDFYTSWCEWCKVQDDSTYSVPAFIDFSRDYVWVKIDAEHGPDTLVAQKYGVKAFPTVIVMKPDGEEYDRVVGYNHPADFMQQVRDYRAGRNTLKALLADEPAHVRDYAYLFKLADRLFGYGRNDEALARYKAIYDQDLQDSSGHAEEAGYMLARTNRRAKKYPEALAIYQSMLQRFPKGEMRANEIYGLALTYKGLGEKEKALETFERYIREYPKDGNFNEAQKEIENIKNPPSTP